MFTWSHEPCRVLIQSPAMNKFGNDVDPCIMCLYEPLGNRGGMNMMMMKLRWMNVVELLCTRMVMLPTFSYA